MKKTRLELFKKKFKVDGSGCWVWQAADNGSGYGQFWIGKKNVLAHRWSYEHFKGKIPEGFHVDHLCKVTKCVNPDHLEAVTQYENLRRGNPWKWKSKDITHCPKGHPYSGKNLYINPSGRKLCVTCRNVANQEYRRGMARKSSDVLLIGESINKPNN